MTAATAEATPFDAALDVAAMEPRLRSALQGRGAPDPSLRLVSARPVVHKAGSRALIAYTFAGPKGRTTIYGKQFAKAVRAHRLERTWRELERVDFGPGAGVPALRGFVPELSLVAYAPAVGRTLDETAGRPDAAAGMHGAGAWLAALHSASLDLERRFDVAGEVEDAGRWAAALAEADPAHGAVAHRVAGRLAAAAGRLPPAVDVPIHKDFHYRHVVVGARLVVLDFDEVRLGDPNVDAAHFCEYLRLLAERSAAVRAQRPALERSFLEGYAARRPFVRDGRFAFFSAYTCLKIAKQLGRGSGVEPRPAGGERDRQLRVVLDRADALAGELG